MSMVSDNVDHIIKRIQDLKQRVMKEEDEVEYKNCPMGRTEALRMAHWLIDMLGEPP